MRMEAGPTDADAVAGTDPIGEAPPVVDDATAAGEEVPEGVEETALPGLDDDTGLQAEMANIADHRITDTDRGQPALRNDDRRPWVVNERRVTAGTVQHILKFRSTSQGRRAVSGPAASTAAHDDPGIPSADRLIKGSVSTSAACSVCR